MRMDLRMLLSRSSFSGKGGAETGVVGRWEEAGERRTGYGDSWSKCRRSIEGLIRCCIRTGVGSRDLSVDDRASCSDEPEADSGGAGGGTSCGDDILREDSPDTDDLLLFRQRFLKLLTFIRVVR